MYQRKANPHPSLLSVVKGNFKDKSLGNQSLSFYTSRALLKQNCLICASNSICSKSMDSIVLMPGLNFIQFCGCVTLRRDSTSLSHIFLSHKPEIALLPARIKFGDFLDRRQRYSCIYMYVYISTNQLSLVLILVRKMISMKISLL